eukprot:g6645.t1
MNNTNQRTTSVLPSRKSMLKKLENAIMIGDQDMVRTWIRCGKGVNAILPTSGCTPLEAAITNRNVSLMKQLLNEGADVEFKGPSDLTPLLTACVCGFFKGVQLLLTRGVNIAARTQSGLTCLMLAAKNKHLSIVSYLLTEKACPINEKDANGFTALHYFVPLNDPSLTFKLIFEGSDVNAQSFDGTTALESAIIRADLIMMKLLLDKGFNIEQKCAQGWTPLMTACIRGFSDGVKLLTDRGANINAQNEDGETPIFLAMRHRWIECLKVLLEAGADPNVDGKCALHKAVRSENVAAVKLLVENKADVNIQNQNGETAIYLAAKNGFVDSLEVLLEYGADPNIRTQREDCGLSGDYALHKAIHEGNINAVKLLLKHGADIAAIRSDGLTPVEVALSSKPPRQDIIDYLFDVSTVTEQMTKLAFRCKYAEQMLQEHIMDIDETMLIREQAELQIEELKTELESHSTRRELAEQTLRSLQSDMEQCVCCPITLEVMHDPVIASDGHTYEREAIKQWLRYKKESPVTRQPLSSSMLIPNIALKHVIDRYEG